MFCFCHISHTFHLVLPPRAQYSGWQAIDNENPSGVRGRVLGNGDDSDGGLTKVTTCKGDSDSQGDVCAETKETCDGAEKEFFCEEKDKDNEGNDLYCNTFAVSCESHCTCTEIGWEPKQEE